MEGSGNQLESAKRRSVLQFAAITGGMGMLSSGASANGGSGQSGITASNSDDTAQLGDFETGLNGWTTTGKNKLERITDDDVPAGVVSGQHGLAIEVDGDLFPMIENKKRVLNTDFAKYPYLQMHVLAQVEDTDSDLLFKFRLHHDSSKGQQGRGSSGNRDANVAESDVMEVSQITPRTMQWDMSDIPEGALQRAKRLEVIWHLEDHEPEGGHRGQSQGNFDYRGLVIFDDIRLSQSAPVSEEQKRRDKKTNLHRNHGMIVDRVFEEQTEDLEQGKLVFSDGFSVPYTFEVLDEGQFEYTIDGDTFELGGGW